MIIFDGGALTMMEFNGMSDFQGVYKNLHTPAVIIGGVFAVMALIISLLLVFLRSYTNPAEQKWIIGVQLMVPVYATESIISLWKLKLSIVCDILRSFYEAFALYSFGSYLVSCLGGEQRVENLLEKGARKRLREQLLMGDEDKGAKHQSSLYNFFFNPNCSWKRFICNRKVWSCTMILKTFCSFLSLLLELFGVYGDAEFKWYYGYPYITGVMNFSQMWALYCLVQFYNVTHHRLEPVKPLAKFISFKAIVFATWWQGVGIAIICYFGVLSREGKIQNGIQDFLICIEVVKDVALTISQAIEPVEKGVHLIQESFHHLSVSSEKEEKGPKVEIKEHIVKDVKDDEAELVSELAGSKDFVSESKVK